MFMGFMAENSVQFRDSGFKVGFEDVDKGVVGLRAQRIVVRLGGDAEADLPGCAPVAAAGAFDAQRLGGEDGNRAVDAGIEPRIEKEGDYVILESAILFEAGLEGSVDKTVAVLAPRELRIERTCRRDDCGPDEVGRRIAAQLDDDTLSGRADYAIVNIFEEDLEPAVVKLDRIFSHEAARH